MGIDKNMCQQFKNSGIAYLESEEFDNAIEALKKYSDCKAEDAEVFMLLGGAYEKLGQMNLAFESYSKALIINPIHTASLIKISELQLSGSNYLAELASMHKYFKPEKYIEIGVCKGASFCLADPKIKAIGIDPEPQLDTSILSENHKVFAVTSDDYFASQKIVNDFEGELFDMAFLDGMHLFEYVLRDFINVELYSHEKSVVFIHDLFPINAETATRERNSDFWTGDVWKLVLCLGEFRTDLDVKVLPCPPSGLGMVSGLDSSSTVLSDNYDSILDKYINMPFDVIEGRKAEKLKLVDVGVYM